MNGSKNKQLIALLTVILALIFGFQAASAELDRTFVEQTVPTRTPVPQPTQEKPPTKQPGGGNGGGNAEPTATSVPPTSTPIPVTLAPTPIDGFVSPSRCGDPFFVASLGTVNVRVEPNTESEVIAKLVYLEARQVLGRSAENAWWQVLLPSTEIGWVFDGAGEMVGQMEVVPIIAADGTHTNDSIWVPTPDSFCPSPTPSPVPTATETPEPRPTASDTDKDEEVDEEPVDGSGATEETSAPVASIEITIDPQAISALPDAEDPFVEVEENTQSSALISRESTQKPEGSVTVISSGTGAATAERGVSWPVLVGLVLIIFGIGALIFQRYQDNIE